MLRDFILANRDAILAQARLRVAERNAPRATEVELTRGLPLFLDQLGEALLRATTDDVPSHAQITESAGMHGEVLFDQGLTVAQVVHDYGDLCQVITGLAVEQAASIGADEFRTLNLCLDDAIAGAVTAYAERRERYIVDQGAEQFGTLAHEMRSHVNTAILTFSSIKKGVVAPGGSTSAIHERSLARMASLVDRAFAEARLAVGLQVMEHVAVKDVIEEIEIGAAMIAQQRGIGFAVNPVDESLVVEADRQILTAAIGNLLQNAFKFTKPSTTVTLRATSTSTRVFIDIEDECGGLPPGDAVRLLQPFVKRGPDKTGLGLGLAICAKAVKVMGGELRIRDLPGVGCVFTIDLPKQPPPPTSIHAKKRRSGAPPGSSSGGGVARAI